VAGNIEIGGKMIFFGGDLNGFGGCELWFLVAGNIGFGGENIKIWWRL